VVFAKVNTINNVMDFQQLVLEETYNKPRRIRKGEPGHGTKKFVVHAKEGDKTKTIRFGDANLKIKKSNPKRRKAFRARHKCDQKKSKLSAGYWACKAW
jgi:hypothetical protein